MGVGFLYRTATIAGGSATWGMRLMGIELRRARRLALRLRHRLPAHGDLHRRLQRGAAADGQHRRHARHALRPGPAGHHPADRDDQPAGGLTGPARRAPENPVAARRDLLIPCRSTGDATGTEHAPQPAAVASVLRDGPAALPVSGGKGRAQAVHRAPGRRRRASERRAVPPGLPPLAERAVPAVLRRLLGLPVGPHRRRRVPPVARPAADPAAQRAASSGPRAVPGRPRSSSRCSAAISTRGTPRAAWRTWTATSSRR